MSQVVNDFDRPDVNGVPPKMLDLCNQMRAALQILPVPFLGITTNDNICSSINIGGSFDAKETWSNGIFENSRYFRFSIMPKDKRYYNAGDVLKVELITKGYKLDKKFRKYSGTPEKVIAKLKEWMTK